MQIIQHFQSTLNLPFDTVAGAMRFRASQDGTSVTLLSWDQATLGIPAPSDADLAAIVALPDMPPVPAGVLDYQFAGEAASEGIITADEAKAWTGSGAIPASLQVAVDAAVTDPVAHDKMTFFLLGAKEFPRYHPNTVLLAKAFGKDTPEKLDAFFVAAGAR